MTDRANEKRQHEHVTGEGEHRSGSTGQSRAGSFKSALLNKKGMLISAAIVLAIVLIALIF